MIRLDVLCTGYRRAPEGIIIWREEEEEEEGDGAVESTSAPATIAGNSDIKPVSARRRSVNRERWLAAVAEARKGI